MNRRGEKSSVAKRIRVRLRPRRVRVVPFVGACALRPSCLFDAFVMAAGASAVVRQNKNKIISNKKKPFKPIRNVLTSSKALHWPLITDENEVREVLVIFKVLRRTYEQESCDKNIKPDKDEQRKKEKNFKVHKHNIKNCIFGINEIAKHIDNHGCQAVLVDSEIPRILVMHLISIALLKQIPLLCVTNLNRTIKETFSFKSSTICFSNDFHVEGIPNVYEVMMNICQKRLNLVYNYNLEVDNAMKHCENSKPETSSAIQDSSDPPSQDLHPSSNFIKLTNEQTVKRQFKRKARFQALLIKRICSNPNR